MREISTKKIEIGEHVMIDGVEYVAEEHDGDCLSCDVDGCGDWFLIPCRDGLALKRVKEQPTEEESKDIPMTCPQLAEWLAKGHGLAKYRDSRAIFSGLSFYEGEENEAVNEDLLIRPWGTDEWVKPTLYIYERDCR